MRRLASYLPLPLLSLCLGGVLAFVGMAAAQTPAGQWTAKASMSAVRGEVAAVAVRDRLYALGGGVSGNAVARNEEYDPVAGHWRACGRRCRKDAITWAPRW
jgi:hypothetical protein